MTSIDVLDIINQNRNKFGLRDSDFHRYRVHCTNKLKTLRKSIGLKQINHKDKKNEKSSFDLQAIDKNPHLHLKYLLISLFQVEHSWASSREIKEQIQVTLKKANQLRSNQSNTSSPTGVSRLRKHSQNRLARAIQHSDQLLDLCNLPSAPLTVETLAQVYVHRLYMKGLFDFELARWESSLDHFVVSFMILKALGNSSSNETDDHKKRVLFYDSMDELSPMIRYCGYKLGLDSIEIDKLSQERFDQTAIDRELIKETSWNKIKSFIDSSKSFTQPVIELQFINRRISIRNPELIELITNVKKADQILASILKTPSLLRSQSPTTDKLINLNKKQRRKLFLQSKNPKLSNSKDLIISLTAGFDRVLAIYTEAENTLQRLIKSNDRALELNSTIQRFDEQSKLLFTIHEIVGFRLLSTRVQRDLRLIEKIQKKIIKQEAKIEDRIKKNSKNFQQINKLVIMSKIDPSKSNQNVNFFNNDKNTRSSNPNSQFFETESIKSLLIKRHQAQLFPSLLKLIEEILFNLDRIKQLKVIEDHHLLSLEIECQISFFKGYRCFIQSKSYLLIEKFLESYILQQKSNFYIRQTRSSLEEIDQEEREDDTEELQELDQKNTTDLNSDFLKFDRARLEFLGDEFQDRLKLEIIKEWIKKKEGQGGIRDEEVVLHTESELKNLSLIDNHDSNTKKIKSDVTNSTVFDLAFNYLTQFDWNELVDGSQQHSTSASQPMIAKDNSRPVPFSQSTDASQPSIDTAPTSAPVKKSGGMWSFFSRS